jgi:hypothetical protein
MIGWFQEAYTSDAAYYVIYNNARAFETIHPVSAPMSFRHRHRHRHRHAQCHYVRACFAFTLSLSPVWYPLALLLHWSAEKRGVNKEIK